MSRAPILAGLIALSSACDEPPAPPPEAPAEGAPAPAPPGREEGQRLGVPPEQIRRAREEAAGLARLPEALRRQALEGRAESPTYRALRADPDAHAHEAARFEGRVGLARGAGPGLWILALHTRREGERWIDPLYVLSVVEPGVPPDGGVEATVYGWVVGERRIGRHALPLIVAYAVEPSG